MFLLPPDKVEVGDILVNPKTGQTFKIAMTHDEDDVITAVPTKRE